MVSLLVSHLAYTFPSLFHSSLRANTPSTALLRVQTPELARELECSSLSSFWSRSPPSFRLPGRVPCFVPRRAPLFSSPFSCFVLPRFVCDRQAKKSA